MMEKIDLLKSLGFSDGFLKVISENENGLFPVFHNDTPSYSFEMNETFIQEINFEHLSSNEDKEMINVHQLVF